MSRPILVCFAVPEEARPFARALPAGVDVLVTGMGAAQTRQTLSPRLDAPHTPRLVLTCGFAGGLNPTLRRPAVVFDADAFPGVTEALRRAGAIPARILGVDRVAVTALDKQHLRETTAADAVEMESWVARGLCRARGIPSATVRVISDEAGEDLPLDFNRILDDRMRLRPGRLAAAILRAPGSLPGLVRLRSHTRLAAERLGAVLRAVLGDAGLAGGGTGSRS